MLPNKYLLYERSVQSPDVHTELFDAMFKEIRGFEARRLREDFCGTFQLSCSWVKQNPKNTALSIDLDPQPIAYGKKFHLASLSSQQKKRLKVTRANVLTPTPPETDLIIACNFSFFIFKDRKTLLEYFKSCFKSLGPKGLFILDMAGGPGMITRSKEQKTIYLEDKRKYRYVWDQKSFDPVTHYANYAIHFKFPDGQILKDAFTYDWRLWTIPEVRELLAEAGFKTNYVYWETEHRGKGTGEYVRSESGTNDFAWVTYLVGVR